jgi:hypothetical protein
MRISKTLGFLLILVFSASYADDAAITCPSTVTCKDSTLQSCTFSNDSNYSKWTPYAELNLQAGTYVFNSAHLADSEATRASGQVHRPECLYVLQDNHSSNMGLSGDTDLLAKSTSDSVSPPWKPSAGSYECQEGSLNMPPSACQFMLANTTNKK